jgi:very-short-patch-repair endonuclease
MYYGASSKLFEYAKQMRYAPTNAEKYVWDILNAEPFLIHKFRRQHPVARYIADFYSHKLKLVIEIDGGIHNLPVQMEYDAFRDEDMLVLGVLVLRLTNEEVLEQPELTNLKIKNCIITRSASL